MDGGAFVDTKTKRCFDLLGLDLKMREARIVHEGSASPWWLKRAIDMVGFLTHQPSVLTYEELIFVNPGRKTRTLTAGEVGKAEVMFYKAHLLIEENLERAIRKVRNAILCGDSGERVRHLEEVEGFLSSVVEGVKELGEMPPEYFGQIIDFLDAHAKYRKHKIPNGGFSAGFHVLEILLRGGDLPLKYLWYFEDNKPYFPRRGRREIRDALELTRTHGGLVRISEKSQDPAFKARVGVIKQFFLEFRAAHYGTVARQEPEILSPTGEESHYGEFLRDRIKDTPRA